MGVRETRVVEDLDQVVVTAPSGPLELVPILGADLRGELVGELDLGVRVGGIGLTGLNGSGRGQA